MPVTITRKTQKPQPQYDISVLDSFSDADSVVKLFKMFDDSAPDTEEHRRARRLLDMYYHVFDMMIGDGRPMAREARDLVGTKIGITLQ